MAGKGKQAAQKAHANGQDGGKNPNTDKPLRVGRIDTPVRIRAERGRLYREARRHEGRDPDALTALRLSQILAEHNATVVLEETLKGIAQELTSLREAVITGKAGGYVYIQSGEGRARSLADASERAENASATRLSRGSAVSDNGARRSGKSGH